MNSKRNSVSDRERRPLYLVLLVIVLLLAAAGAVYAVTMKRSKEQAPKLLNQPTEARVVKPFTTQPDKRFAPVPIEREKHSK